MIDPGGNLQHSQGLHLCNGTWELPWNSVSVIGQNSADIPLGPTPKDEVLSSQLRSPVANVEGHFGSSNPSMRRMVQINLVVPPRSNDSPKVGSGQEVINSMLGQALEEGIVDPLVADRHDRGRSTRRQVVGHTPRLPH